MNRKKYNLRQHRCLYSTPPLPLFQPKILIICAHELTHTTYAYALELNRKK